MHKFLVTALFLTGNFLWPASAAGEEGFKTSNAPPAIKEAWANTFEVVTLQPATELSHGFAHMGSAFPVKKETIGGKCYVMLATAAHVVDDQINELGANVKKYTAFLAQPLNYKQGTENYFIPAGKAGFFSKAKMKKSPSLIAFEASAETAKLKISYLDHTANHELDTGAFLLSTSDPKLCAQITPLPIPKDSECSSLTAVKNKSYVVGFPKTTMRPALASTEGGDQDTVVKSFSTGVFTGTNNSRLGTTADAIQGNSGGPILAIAKSGATFAVSLVQRGASFDKNKGEVYNGDDKKLIPHVTGIRCQVFISEMEKYWAGFKDKILSSKLASPDPVDAGNVMKAE